MTTGAIGDDAEVEKGPLLTVSTPAAPSLRTRLVACVQYGSISVSITLFNRAVFSVYHFNFPCFFTLVQILVSIACLLVLGRLGVIEVGRLTWAGARKMAPLAFFWWLYVVSGIIALRYLNVPMFSVLRRGTTVLVVLGEWHLLGKRSTTQQLMCLALMVGGAVVAGATDLTFSAPGYAWVGVCVAATAAYLLLIRLLRDASGLGQHTMLLYNNVLSLPLMLVALAGAQGELPEVWRYERLRDPEFLVFFFVACSQAFVLNLCIFRCTLLNSPLATNVTGQVKDILTTTLGVLLFADVRLTRFNLGGLCVGLLGSLLYSLESYKAARKAPAKTAS